MMFTNAGFNSFDCLLCDHTVLIGLCYGTDAGLIRICPDFVFAYIRGGGVDKTLIIRADKAKA